MRLDPVGEVPQAVAVRVRAARTVVADLDDESLPVDGCHDVDPLAGCMFGGVGDALTGDEPTGGLDARIEVVRGVAVDGHHSRACQLVQRGRQAARGQGGRQNAMNQCPDVIECGVQLADGEPE